MSCPPSGAAIALGAMMLVPCAAAFGASWTFDLPASSYAYAQSFDLNQDGVSDPIVIRYNHNPQQLIPRPPLPALPGLPVFGDADNAIWQTNHLLGQSDGDIVAIDGASGDLLWKTSLAGTPTNLLLADYDGDGVQEVFAYANVNDYLDRGFIYLLDSQTGDIRGSTFTPDAYAVSLDVADLNSDGMLDVIFATFGNDDPAVYAVDGTALSAPIALPTTVPVVDVELFLLWSAPIPYQGWVLPPEALRTVDLDGNGILDVLVASDSREVYAFRGEDGAEMWTFSRAASWTSVATGTDDTGNTVVYVPGKDGLYALDGSTGGIIWKSLGYAFSRPALTVTATDGHRVVFTGDTSYRVLAFDADTGALLWANEREGGRHNYELFDVEAADMHPDPGLEIAVSTSLPRGSGFNVQRDEGVVAILDAETGVRLEEIRLGIATFALSIEADSMHAGSTPELFVPLWAGAYQETEVLGINLG